MEQSTRGVNYFTDLNINQNKITAVQDKEILFDLTSELIINSGVINQELILELNEENGPTDHNLTEIRFFSQNPNKEDKLVEKLDEKLKQQLNLQDNADDLICTLPDLPFIVPRGKYTASIFVNYLKLHGTSYNYKIPYEIIKKAFLLPLSDNEHVYFVINFEKPLRQGNTIYKYGIINFKTNMEIALELIQNEEVLQKISPNLTKEMEGRYFEIFSKLFKSVTNIDIIVPGEFRSTKNAQSIKCSMGARQGELFILKKSLIFVPKSVVYISYNEILRAEFHRISDTLQNKNFDLGIITKSGETYLFSGIDKQENIEIKSYLQRSKINTQIVEEDNNDLDDQYEDDQLEVNSAEQESGKVFDRNFINDDDDSSEDEDFDPTKLKKKNGKDKSDNEEDQLSQIYFKILMVIISKIFKSTIRLFSNNLLSKQIKILIQNDIPKQSCLLYAYSKDLQPNSRNSMYFQNLKDLFEMYKEIIQSLQDDKLDKEDKEFYKQEQQQIKQQIEEETQNIIDEIDNIKDVEQEQKVTSAMLEFRGTVGGEEAQIFADEIFTIYSNYLSKKGYRIEDKSSEGQRICKLKVYGESVYKEMLFESGVHRVIRVPVTERQGRVQTSAMQLLVLPEVPLNFEMKMNELKFEYMRAQGPGGQHVNKTESACRCTHIPSGVSVMMQDSREQQKNKERAIVLLREKLFQIEQEKRQKKLQENRKQQTGLGDRSEKIRTYHYPQDRITDHRLNKTVYNIKKQVESGQFFDECIDEFMEKEQENEVQDFFNELEEKFLNDQLVFVLQYISFFLYQFLCQNFKCLLYILSSFQYFIIKLLIINNKNKSIQVNNQLFNKKQKIFTQIIEFLYFKLSLDYQYCNHILNIIQIQFNKKNTLNIIFI